MLYLLVGAGTKKGNSALIKLSYMARGQSEEAYPGLIGFRSRHRSRHD